MEAGNSDHIIRQIHKVTQLRNELAGHMIGGGVSDAMFRTASREIRKLIQLCEVAELVSAVQADLLLQNVRGIIEHRYKADDLLDHLPGRSPAESVRKCQSRMRRLTGAQARILHDEILGSSYLHRLVQSPPGSGKTLLCNHLALRFLDSRLGEEDDEVRRFLLLTHSTALAAVCARYIYDIAQDWLNIDLVTKVMPVGRGIILSTRDPLPPTEVCVFPVDTLISSVVGIKRPRSELPSRDSWRQEVIGGFHAIAVDEGHRVFSTQQHAHLPGQHLLRRAEDVLDVVEAVAAPHCRITIFHDEDYQGDGVECCYPDSAKPLKAGLACVRNTAAVRDASTPHAQSLSNVVGRTDAAHYVPMADPCNTGRDVELVDVAKPSKWRRGAGNVEYGDIKPDQTFLGFRMQPPQTWNDATTAQQIDSSGSGVLVYTEYLQKARQYEVDANINSATDLYTTAIVDVLRRIDPGNLGLGWGDVAVVLPGNPEGLARQVHIACKRRVFGRFYPQPYGLRTVLKEATADATDIAHLYFGPAENLAGLERAIVVVTGFWHPMSLLAQPPSTAPASDTKEEKFLLRTDHRVYLAITRCTHQLYIAEPDVGIFASHFRIQDVEAEGGIAPPVGDPVGGSAAKVQVRAAPKGGRGVGELRLEDYHGSREDMTPSITRLQGDGNLLKTMSLGVKSDKAAVMAAVRQNGMALRFASVELQNNRDIVVAAARQNYKALMYASPELRSDSAFVFSIVRRNGMALEHASPECRNQGDLVLAAVQSAGLALQFASVDQQMHRDVVLAAVKENGEALLYAPRALQKDRDIVVTAVSQNGWVLKDAPRELWGDREVILAAVKHNCKALEYAPAELHTDRAFVLAAVRKNGHALRFASHELRDDRQFVLDAVKNNRSALEYVSVALRSDSRVLRAVWSEQ
mmetsp:Transcript_17672/g.52343  ORF Transcript_17672/g.52343 Transcript_17672/m.52343 type:complete len:917 (+) Transcript_17672:638-3388(+)